MRSGKLSGSAAAHIAAIIVLGVLVYSNTFNSPFFFDDIVFIDDPKVESLKNIPSLFLRPEGSFASRPVLHATIALNYYLDGYNTRGYHVVNVCVHLLNAILVYFLLMKTLRLCGRTEDFSRTAAAVASVVFVLHPVHTDAVTYIVSRTMLFATAFYLIGLLIFIRAVTSERNKLFYASALFLVSILGVGSRENFATFPAMLLIYDYLFVSGMSFKKTFRHYWAYLPVVASLGYLAFLVTRHTYLSDASYGEGVANPDYFRTQFSVQWTYLRLLVLPFNQNLDYNYPIAKSILRFPTILACLGYLALWVVALVLVRRRRLVSFSMLWFLVAFLPISFLVTFLPLRLEDVIFEHRLYLPSVGAVGLVGLGMASALEKLRTERSRVALALLVVLVTLALGVTAYARNEMWRSQIGMWKDVTVKSPGKPRGFHMLVGSYNNQGVKYEDEGLLNKAEEYFNTAISMDPGNADARTNLGFMYLRRGLPDKAREQFEYALDKRPSSEAAHVGLARALKAQGFRPEAERHLRIASNLAPSAAAHYYLGVMYMENDDPASASLEFRKALAIDPGHVDARRFLEFVSSPRRVPPH